MRMIRPWRRRCEAGRMKIARVLEGLRTIVGVPPYRLYREHMAECHPDVPVMTPTEFFLAQQQARYGAGGRGRCC